MSGIDLFGNDIVEEQEEAPAKRKRRDLFKEFLPDLMMKKENILRQDPEAEKDFSTFIVNRAMSMHIDTVLYANEINKIPGLSKQMVYDFYIHAIRKGKRYGWAKKTNEKDLDIVMKFYNYNEQKALDVLNILSEKDIEAIKHKMRKGGRK